MAVVNYFERTYLGLATVDSEVSLAPAYSLDFWNRFNGVLADPNFPKP